MALVKHDERYGPYMTGNNAPSPYVASASQSNWGAFRAFSESLDDDISFTGLAAGTEQWVQIKLDAAIRIWAFRIACRTTVSAKDAGQVPKNFKVQGSTDGTTFEDIQAYTAVDWSQFTSWDATNNKYDWADAKKIEVTCAKEYQYYRFQFGECQSVSTQKTDSMIPTSSNTVKLTLIDIYQVEGEEAPAELTGIEVTTPPTKLEYTVGETFDGTGMVVSRVYSDDSRVATEDYTVSGFDSSVAGIKTVTVTCDGYSATFDVIVTAQVTGITVVPPTKTEYLYGEPLDTAGMAVKVNYSDGTSADVTDYTLSGYDANKLGGQIITVTYQGLAATFSVTVSNTITGIEVTPPTKLSYFYGEAIDLTGMVVTATYLDDTTAIVTDYAVSGYDANRLGEQDIAVTYESFTATFTVTVNNAVAGITVTPPAKLDYYTGEELDTTGMSVRAVWLDGTRTEVTDYAVSGFDSVTAGAKTVVISYNGHTDSFTVTVQQSATVSGIEIASLPDKTVYDPGEAFNSKGLVVNALYSDGSKLAVVGYTVSGYSSTVGTKTITVSYQGFSASFDVRVRNVITQNIGSPTLSKVTARLDLDTGELVISGNGKIKDFTTSTPLLSADQKKIVKVVVEEGVTSLGNFMCYGYPELTEVTLPESITMMGRNVFWKTAKLETVYYNCLSCDSSGWISGTTYYTLFKESGLKNVAFGSNVKKIPAGLFWNAVGLTDIVLPLSVETIEKSAFRGCTGIKRVSIDKNITSMGENIFYGGGSKTIYIRKAEGSVSGAPWGASSSEIVWLGKDAILDEESALFYRLKNGNATILGLWDAGQVEVHVPASIDGYAVTAIDPNSFKGSSVDYIFVGSPEGAISGEPWGRGGVKVFWSDTVFEDGVVYKVADGEAYVYAFYDSTGVIKDVEVKGLYEGVPVKRISGGVFYGKSLERITLPDVIEAVESGAFVNCSADVNIPASLKKVGNAAFQGSGIKNALIPPSVEELGVYIFSGCKSLIKLEYQAGIKIPDGFCYETALKTVSVPGNIKEVGRYAFYRCSGLLKVSLADSITNIGDLAFFECTGLEEIHMPEQLITISKQAFDGCSSLKAITLPDSITTFGYRCFYGTGLESVRIPSGITDWAGSQIFGYCKALKKVILAEGLESVGYLVFEACTSLTELEIPASLKNIESNAFMGCGFNGHITLPGTVERLARNAFLDCPIKTFAILNPDCVIGDGSPMTTGSTDTVIYGYPGSTAEAYAAQYDILQFVPLCYGTHTVTFLDINSEVFYTQVVDCGFFASTPETVPDAVDGFSFCGWEVADERVVDDVSYPAIYEVDSYMVTWRDYDGTVLHTERVRYLDDAIPPDNPSREGYLFTGWDKAYTEIATDTVITATYAERVRVAEIQIADIEIKNGTLQALSYTVIPDDATDKSVSFVSADETVVSVSGDGTLQANSAGSTTITIAALDGSGVTATCTVTVAADDEVTSLWLIPNEFYLQIGKTSSITTSIIAGDDADTALLWTSSDTGVATVDKNGKVKGVAVGKATITARLKSDAAIYATSKVDVIAKDDYIRELYADDSVHKETVIHSVDGKFDDITNADIKAESMVIKEAVSGSAPAYLGGCISNSFEILVHTKRFFNKAPSGEIQVYQKVGGVKVNLFHGVIDSAKKQEDRITRRIVAYDKMHTSGDINISSWFKKLKFPITVGAFRKKLFKKIGISHQGVKLPCDEFKIYKNYVYYTDSNEGVPTIDPNKKTDKKHDLYSVPDTLKAVDVIRDICEVSGRWGWMNRTGTFEYVDPYVFDLDYITGEKEKKYLHPIKIQDDNKSYAVKAVELYLDDKEIDPLVYVWGGGSYSNKRKYSLDDSNFIVSATRGEWMSPKNYNTCEMAIVEEVAKTLHDKNWVSFTCTQRFDATIKIGTDVYYDNLKKLSDGTSYKWTTYSAVLERTIKGCQSMLETVSASVGPLSSSTNKKKKTVDKTKKTEKTVSDLKREVGSLGSSYYGNGGGSGGGLKAVSVTELPANPDSNTIYLIQGEVTVN